MSSGDRYWKAKRVTLLGALKNILLAIIKVTGGTLWQSHALLADGVHSFADLITDFLVLFAAKFGSQTADHSHPYGHQRIETAATLMLALLLALAGFGIGLDALDELLHDTPKTPGFLTLPVILFSLIMNEALFHYTRFVGKSIGSGLIIANAWHHRSDAASSAVVLAGLLASFAGYPGFDAIAAIIVGAMIIRMGIALGWGSIRELVDTAAPKEVQAEIARVIAGVDGVVRIHQLRSRMMGGEVLVDVHVLVAPTISVSEGHYIAQHVHRALTGTIAAVRDVVVHIDPEDDEEVCPSLHLPNRATLNASLLDDLRREFPGVSEVVLHYLDGRLTMDIFCTPEFKDHAALETWLTAHARDRHDIADIRTMAILKDLSA